jgi:hypothetical protein
LPVSPARGSIPRHENLEFGMHEFGARIPASKFLIPNLRYGLIGVMSYRAKNRSLMKDTPGSQCTAIRHASAARQVKSQRSRRVPSQAGQSVIVLTPRAWEAHA